MTSWLFISHPVVVFSYILIFFLLVFLYNHPVFILTAFVLAVWQTAYHVGFLYLTRKLKIPCLFCFLVALLNPLLNHRGTHILFYLFEKPVTLEAVAYGGYMLLLILTMLTLMIYLNQVVGMGKLLYLFSRVAPQTGFITGMSLRYYTYLKKEATDYFGVQNSREVETPVTMLDKIKGRGTLLTGFSTMILEKGLQTGESLRAKEYGKHRRTQYAYYWITPRDVLFLVSCLAFYLAGIAFRLNGAGKLDYYRNLSEFGFETISLYAYLLLVCYMLLPFVVDGIRAVRRFIN